MYRLQCAILDHWFNIRDYKTKRAAMVNLAKRKFEVPDAKWRVLTEPTADDHWAEKVKTISDKKDGLL